MYTGMEISVDEPLGGNERPYQTSLLDVAQALPLTDDQRINRRWLSGVRLRGFGRCDALDIDTDWACEISEDGTDFDVSPESTYLDYDEDSGIAVTGGWDGIWRPFIFSRSNHCSTIGLQRESDLARLVSTVEHHTSERLAKVINYQGDQMGMPTLATTANAVTAAAIDPLTALSQLEAAQAAASGNRQGLVWMTPGVLQYLSDHLVFDGDRWFTANGNVVVADVGFLGYGPLEEGEPVEPTDASIWMYASPMVYVVVDEVETPSGPAQGIILTRNTAVEIVKRNLLYAFTPTCDGGPAVFAAEVTYEDPQERSI